MENRTKMLAGKTVFITGASRGIGLAIALRCAKDGANIVIAAKTAEPHPALPGTIYTAAEEIKKAGGKCLPCITDIRFEDQVKKAVDEAAKTFGGIDILVNNASAISLTGTADTPMKKYDLMHSINTRGTYLCSKVCLPYLEKGKNPHILNISPPLNMRPVWFQNHVAYTMAKYGMSMCVLGMAAEFKNDGIAVNALWPKTAIWTAAMANHLGGESVKAQCRSTDIVADAAYLILTQDSRKFSGNFCIDENVLSEKGGVKDFDKYAMAPGAKPMTDFFLDEADLNLYTGAKDKFTFEKEGKPEVAKATFDQIKNHLSNDLVKSIGGVFVFDLAGDGKWYVDLRNGSGAVGQGEPQAKADCTMTMATENLAKMFSGKLNASAAFMSGKLKIDGNMGLAMKLEQLLAQTRSKL